MLGRADHNDSPCKAGHKKLDVLLASMVCGTRDKGEVTRQSWPTIARRVRHWSDANPTTAGNWEIDAIRHGERICENIQQANEVLILSNSFYGHYTIMRRETLPFVFSSCSHTLYNLRLFPKRPYPKYASMMQRYAKIKNALAKAATAARLAPNIFFDPTAPPCCTDCVMSEADESAA